ncbi:nucleolar complex-associated protein-domain-containing protein [Neohortaea acidophila]|uniref:Nucleolar complex-associated protein 3 n=1 Tax=Neohortaea acidophila TaxID=245834 RepID=A0A6A6PR15_9PEZI|nr:nucleolar complex-associated protein-domain-containing protein [Neohortaea acidophila]KAF2481647.1 nucleolar complex-associated protein-domain-containing protein [Neohortaea acidophila]
MESATKRRKLSASSGGRANVPGFAQWNLEQDYETRRRKDGKKKKAEDNRLPVKSQESGQWEQDRSRPVDDEEDNDSFLASDDEETKDNEASKDVLPPPKPRKPRLPPKEEIRQAKEDLARIAGQIGEDPEEHIGLLGSLAEIGDSPNISVKKLALGAQLAVFKDIVPGYRIRPIAPDDANAKISKDVRKLRAFEQGLLRGYQSYVQLLSRLCKKKKYQDEKDASLTTVATSCVCNLVINLPHFNYRNDLIRVVVQKLASRNVDADFLQCQNALETLFQNDEEGHTSLEAVSQLTKMMKAKDYNIVENVLNTFLHLRLLGEFAHKASTQRIDKEESNIVQPKQKKAFRTKRERKLQRERKEVEKEMKEADAVVSYEERDRNQAETLKLVFIAYFRILKARTPHLMGAVLEGLAKYAHLINQDFFGDVLEALKDLIGDTYAAVQEDAEGEAATDDEARNATRELLLCIITAFALLQGQHDVAKSASSLHLDLNFFITHLYRTLLPLSLNQDIELGAKTTTHLVDPNGLDVPSTTLTPNKVNVATTSVLLLRSLHSVLLPPTGTKLVSPVRVAAFTKQLLTSTLHVPRKSCAAILALLQQMTKVHASKVAALWHTEERKGDGVFYAESGEVESSNPFAATVWEGELLRLHFDPKVREAVVGIEKGIVERAA